MAPKKIKVAQIGNSRGVRLPAEVLRRYRIEESLLMEETPAGILLRPLGGDVEKLSWEDTAREMAASNEDWTDWDEAPGDGLEDLPWESESKVAEPKTRYGTRPRARKAR
jgi:antitoxin component of MazEF toxin-antitoxin module